VGCRELAVQIQKVVLALGDYMSVQCHACIGGTSINEDIKKLDYGQHVVSGTPGRYALAVKRGVRFWAWERQSVVAPRAISRHGLSGRGWVALGRVWLRLAPGRTGAAVCST
jgi:hypothetical protein